MMPRREAGSNRHRNILVIITVILAIIGFLSFGPSIKRVVAVAKMHSTQDAITIGLTLHEIDEKDISNLDLNNWQKQYLARHEVPLSLVSLDYIYVPENILAPGDSLCVGEIKILNEFSITPAENVIYLVNKTDDHYAEDGARQQEICFFTGKNVLLPQYFQIAPAAYSQYVDPFFYPFDGRTINYSLSSTLYKKNTGQNLSTPIDVLMSVSPPRWIADTSVISQSAEAEEQGILKLKTTLHRSPLIVILSAIIPVSILFIIIMLPRIKDEVGSFWEVIVGLILGLWGLSEVLIPEYVDYPTVIEAFILILYGAISVFVIIFVVTDFFRRQQLQRVSLAPHIVSLDDIPNHGDIEGLFLWAIGKLNKDVSAIKIAEALFIKAQSEKSTTYKKKLIEAGEKLMKS